MELNEDGYIIDISVEEAMRIFDDLYLSLGTARGNGKTRMLYNYTKAWTVIREFIEEKSARPLMVKDCLTKHKLWIDPEKYDQIVNDGGFIVEAVGRGPMYVPCHPHK